MKATLFIALAATAVSSVSAATKKEKKLLQLLEDVLGTEKQHEAAVAKQPKEKQYELTILDEDKHPLIDLEFSPDHALTPADSGNGTDYNFTEQEIMFMDALNWCTDGQSIQWIDKSAEALIQRVKEGAKTEPARDEQGKIQDLNGFISERIEVVPLTAQMDDLPTLIIEDECAYVEEPTEDCVFDYAGTPIPQQWALQDELSLGSGDPIPFREWDTKYQFTVVYVPAQNASEEAQEFTSKTDDGLAELRLRGFSSRDNPKKQMRLRFKDRNTHSLIPGTPPARKWILSSKLGVQSDRTYIQDPVVFESYRRLGELQRQYLPTWPENGTVGDLASRAWSPHSHQVNIVYQGRFIGLFTILEQVEVIDNGGRVWVEEQIDLDSAPQPEEIDGIMIPTGSYFIELNWDEPVLESFHQPTRPEWVSSVLALPYQDGSLGVTNVTSFSAPLWTIDYPDDKSFYEYSQDDEDPDVHNLRRILDAIFRWAEDPIANNDKLAEVIDMKSMARYFLMEELTREGDAYLGSAKHKFVNGKLYNAALWDFGGNIFAEDCTMYDYYIDFESDTVQLYECDNATGMPINGWHVDSFWDAECMFLNYDCSSIQSGTRVNDTHIWDMRFFWRQLFRAPSMQEEFWALWDLAVEHKLTSDDEEADVASSNDGDLFSLDKIIDQMYSQVKNSAQADASIWNVPIAIANLALYQLWDNFTSVGGNCVLNLTTSLLSTVSENHTDGNLFTIPANYWSFSQAETIGNEFSQFLSDVELPPEFGIDLAEYFDSDEVVASMKRYINARLEWIGQQKPQPSALENSNTNV